MKDVLTELKKLQITKNQTNKIISEIYQANREDINNSYFYYIDTNITCCKLDPVSNDIKDGYLGYKKFFIGTNYDTMMPQIFSKRLSFKLSQLPLDKILFISKSNFIDTLKTDLQKAMDAVEVIR